MRLFEFGDGVFGGFRSGQNGIQLTKMNDGANDAGDYDDRLIFLQRH